MRCALSVAHLAFDLTAIAQLALDWNQILDMQARTEQMTQRR
jgi:hypothetical protein